MGPKVTNILKIRLIVIIIMVTVICSIGTRQSVISHRKYHLSQALFVHLLLSSRKANTNHS